MNLEEIKYKLKDISVTNYLIGINVFLFIIFRLFSILIGDFNSFQFMGAFSIPWALQGELWRIFTSAFLHANELHLLLNMYALWLIGNFVEKFFGTKKYLIIYFLSVVGAGLLSFTVEIIPILFFGSRLVSYSVGASGAIFGLFGLVLGTNLQRQRYGLELPIDTNQLLLILGINLLIGFSIPSINNSAHIGGLIVGLFSSVIFKPQNYFGSKLSHNVENIIFWVLITIVVLSIFAHIVWALTSLFIS